MAGTGFDDCARYLEDMGPEIARCVFRSGFSPAFTGMMATKGASPFGRGTCAGEIDALVVGSGLEDQMTLGVALEHGAAGIV